MTAIILESVDILIVMNCLQLSNMKYASNGLKIPLDLITYNKSRK